MTDGKTGQIQDKFIIPYLKQDKWAEGIKVANEYNVNVGAKKAVGTNDHIYLILFRLMVISLLLGIILGILCRFKKIESKTAFIIASIYGVFMTILVIFISKDIRDGLFGVLGCILSLLISFEKASGRDLGGGSFSDDWSSYGDEGSSGGGGSSRSF